MIQLQEMQRLFPDFRFEITQNRGAVWTGTLSPTSDSPNYQIRICHERHQRPAVFVLSPELVPHPPHTYVDGRLCLYWPEEWEWSERESLALTIVPWTSLWLYFYELWLLTGEWLGPASPHGSGAREKP